MKFRTPLSAIALAVLALSAGAAPSIDDGKDDSKTSRGTSTPIKHVIVVVGENHTFDNLFGGYKPRNGQHVHNLLSQGIIKADGTPGPNFSRAVQQQAGDTSIYQTAPLATGPYAFLPQPQTTYATGLPPGVPDARFPANLPPGPFQITHYAAYDSYVGDPPHRFFQMWQQVDQGKNDLFAWVGVTAGIGPDASFNPPSYGPGHDFQGGEAMGFYNMSTGDAPKFEALAQRYALSDNYHQPIMGGTGANFISLVTGDAGFFTVNGKPAKPFDNQIENPDPQPGTNNWYKKDGYTGGSYVNCADITQPGVKPIMDAINAAPGKPFRSGNCAADTYYLVNNYGMGYTFDGKPKPVTATNFTLPPQTIPTIADALEAKGVAWKYYSGGRQGATVSGEYCTICDPLTAFTSIMTSPMKSKLQGMTEFYADAAAGGAMPAVSFVRPFESKAGHPANAKTSDFEDFVVDLVDRVKANPALWKETAILITVDEGGGYYDSGYIQPVDFFGDGTRIPLLAVSPWARRGHVDHTYSDHVSVLKFIERNWGLQPLSQRSRDNLPNPVQPESGNRYVPVNRPAIGDLMGLFDFERDGGDE
jgi:acid phosphatase